MILIYQTSSSDSDAVGSSVVQLGGSLIAGQTYIFLTNADCWIRQGTCRLLTCVTKANLVDGETVTIVSSRGASTYEFDVSGNGVVSGNVQVNVSTDTTAAQVAARLRTAILATQTWLEVTDNSNGTLTIAVPDSTMSISDTVANATFTNAAATMTVAASDGSTFVPSRTTSVILDGKSGPQLAVIQDGSSTGKCSLTKMLRY